MKYGDLISRAKAVDALKQLQKAISGDYTELDPMVMAGCGYIGDCIGELEDLPSAQPYTADEVQKMADLEQAEIEKAFELGREDALSEIIRCKDCKWWASEEEGTNKRCNVAKYGHMSRHWDIYICRTYPADFYCADADKREEE